MTVNPKLATLMRVIDDNKDKMTEGEYLEAMNALGALHRDIPAYLPPADASAARAAVGPPPSYAASVSLFSTHILDIMGGSVIEQRSWERVKAYHPDPFQNRISAEEWILLPYDTRFRLVREATENYANEKEALHRTPEPSVCPFITRHAVGTWSMEEHGGNTNWECVCGYIGKVKNWKKHEQSERHQIWNKHRTVSRRKIQKMKATINDDEIGKFIRFACYAPNPNELYPGGIQIYTVWQDKNEWTHPEMFTETHRNPVPTEDGVGKWFVHPRNLLAKQYIQ